MQWVLLGIIVVLLLLMSTRYPKAAFGTLGVLLLSVAILVYITRDDGSLRLQKLSPASVHIENVVVVPAYGGGYQFNARLVNSHPSVLLKESAISITLLDCADETQDNCQVIGQTDERVTLHIPAGQVRDISLALHFDTAEPKGHARWQYRISGTRS